MMTACDKGGEQAGDPNFAGTYVTTEQPIFATLEAKDPQATALCLQEPTEELPEGTYLTYEQVSMLATGLLSSMELPQLTLEFNANGAFGFTVLDPEAGEQKLLDATVQPAMATWAANNGKLVITLTSNYINGLMGASELTPEETAQIKGMLAAFKAGIAVYDPATGNGKVNLRYVLNGNDLKIYVDKEGVVATWNCAYPVLNGLMQNPDSGLDEASLQMLNLILPQVGPMFDGLTKMEAGLNTTKK